MSEEVWAHGAGKGQARQVWTALTLILALAAGLRIWRIGYDLPYIYHPDEPGYIARSQDIFKTGDLNPHFFNYPSLFFYLNALAYFPYYLAGKVAGAFRSHSDILVPVSVAMGVTWSPMPTTVLLGRGLTVLWSVGAVLLAYAIGWRISGRALVGLLAAAMMAISPTLVWNGRLVTPDTFVTTLILAAVWMSVEVWREGRAWQYAAAGICAGLAASTKYNGALAVLPIALAHLLRHGKRAWRDYRIYLAAALSLLAFAVATPFALVDPRFLADLAFEARHYATGHVGMEGNTMVWYVSYLVRNTGLLAVLAAIEIVRGLIRRSRPTLLLAVFPLAYFLFISRFVVRNDRTIMPLVPCLFLLAASLLADVWHWVRTIDARSCRRWAVAGWGAGLMACLAVPLAQTIDSSLALTQTSSREMARVWIEGSLPPGTRIALESYGPFIDPHRFQVEGFGMLIQHPAEWYIEQGFEYLVFGEGMFGRFYREPERYGAYIDQYEALFSRFELARRFDEGGYTVCIYRVSPGRALGHPAHWQPQAQALAPRPVPCYNKASYLPVRATRRAVHQGVPLWKKDTRRCA